MSSQPTFFCILPPWPDQATFSPFGRACSRNSSRCIPVLARAIRLASVTSEKYMQPFLERHSRLRNAYVNDLSFQPCACPKNECLLMAASIRGVSNPEPIFQLLPGCGG